MADILSTLRELRSLEEKRAHGTLSPEEEARFQELQNAVSSRGPKPGPPTSMPVAAAAPAPPPALAPSPVVVEDPPFVDAELTEEPTLLQAETLVAFMPVEPPAVLDTQMVLEPPASLEMPAPDAPPVTEEAPAPMEAPAPDEAQTVVAPVPMSPAELRQWNASFQSTDQATETAAESAAAEPAEAAAVPSVFAAPPDESASPASPALDWLPPAPVPLADPAPNQPPPLALGPPPTELFIDTTPEPTLADDAPMVWSPPIEAPANEPTLQIAIPVSTPDDVWTASVSWSAGIPPPGLASDFTPEPTPDLLSDNEPTKLVPAASVLDPFAPDTFEPAAFAAPSQDGGQIDGSSAEVSTKKYTPIGEAFAAGESRVVVHTLGGVQKRGTITDAHMNADFLELRLQSGEREQLSTAGLKAVFFVVPIGQEVPKPVGDPVTVTLQDGHQLVGLSPDYQVGAVGFFLCPTDQRSRTAKIYIYAGSVKAIS